MTDRFAQPRSVTFEGEEVARGDLAEAPVHMLEPVAGSDSILLLGYPCLSEERIRVAVERIAHALERVPRLSVAAAD